MEYRKIIKLDFRDFTYDVLQKSWEWLDDPQIKEQTSTTDFTKDSSEKWFENLNNRRDYFIKSIWHNDKVIAVMGIKHLNEIDGEVFGYIGDKEYWGKSVGVQGLEYLIEYAKSIKLQSIYSVVLKNNVTSLKLNRRLGFEIDGERDEKKIIMRLYL